MNTLGFDIPTTYVMHDAMCSVKYVLSTVYKCINYTCQIATQYDTYHDHCHKVHGRIAKRLIRIMLIITRHNTIRNLTTRYDTCNVLKYFPHGRIRGVTV